MYVYFMENTTHSFGRHFVSVVAARVEALGISHSEFGRRVFGASDGGRTWRAVRDPKARENRGFSCLMNLRNGAGAGLWTSEPLSGPCFSHFHRRRRSKKRGVNLLSIYCILGVNLLYVRAGGILMSVRAFCIPLKEAAKRIGVSHITMRKYCRDGSIDARKTPGGHWRVSSLSLELFQPGKKRIDEICRMFEHESA